MSEELYSELAWLPQPPEDFRKRCRAAADGAAAMQLAGYALDENHLRQLADAIARLQTQGQSLAPLTPFKLGVLGNATLEPLVPALVASAARYGIALECVPAAFGQTVQEALSADSVINRAKPDAVLVAIDYRGLPLGSVTDALNLLQSLRDGFRKHAGALSILATVAPPPETLFGSLDRSVAGTLRNFSAAFNAGLTESVAGTQDVVFDVGALAETVGLANWYSPTQWNIAKFGFDAKFLPLYSDHAGRIVAALRGKSRRCLILDLDNTIWGGVIGDDGIEGIVIGQGDATGEAYLEVQRAALALRERGVVLAVASKNSDEIARSVFREHPEMLLRENHIAVFQINWNDKVSNIRAIADRLSLGLDSLVFLDDNPFERGLVREMLPEVAVPELPDDPALYARTLAAAGYFEAIAFSQEDRKRAQFYQENARRTELAEQATDLGAYLASLNMRIDFRPFDAAGRSRIAQLINKSNQFNLTTRRYSEIDVAAMESDKSLLTLQVRLADNFGDNGMISVAVCKPRSPEEWEIDTWLMSCRVLGRGVEQMVLREILLHAKANGVRRVIGVYRPTERNDLVRDHYEKLGFKLVTREQSGVTTWELDAGADVEPAPMTVERSGFERTLV